MSHCDQRVLSPWYVIGVLSLASGISAVNPTASPRRPVGPVSVVCAFCPLVNPRLSAATLSGDPVICDNDPLPNACPNSN